MRGIDVDGICPWHQGVDVFGQMTVGEADEEIAQIGGRIASPAISRVGKSGRPPPSL
ncbi:hypothetical protein GGQ79_001621 [Ochrobactrum pecoris]|uniref:Uncharacterized protein n=1 Tax=Brucella pecoris TaxID=867683 RepID=A0AB34YQC1_9HYPH|nr:hypothetical protein [Brucella tritici]MBB4093119.1 hypothetical protein [Brucella pecoris]